MAPMMDVMYQNTLMNLYAGVVSAIDREVLSYSPLPSNIVDPYASQDVDPANTMNLTYSAMVVWIDEAKKADYFSKHFVALSKMIMSGTRTMARGLVTMHGRGEDLSSAPMSIGDLISLSSYHFRKSYLGVIQTAKTRPEISERLLLNQLGWCNTLMRLYKTKEKLEKPASIAVPHDSEAQLPGNQQENPAIEETKAAGQLNEASESAALPMASAKADQGVGALREPGSFTEAGAYNVIRAFTSYDHHDSSAKKTSRALNAANDKKTAAAAIGVSKKNENSKAIMSGIESGLPEAVRSEKTNPEQEYLPGENEKTGAEVRTSENSEEIQTENNETKKTDILETGSPETITDDLNVKQTESVREIGNSDKKETVPDPPEDVTKERISGDPGTVHNRSVSNIPSEDDLTEDEKEILSSARNKPGYLSGMRMRVAEPDFCELFPKVAESFGKVLSAIDST